MIFLNIIERLMGPMSYKYGRVQSDRRLKLLKSFFHCVPRHFPPKETAPSWFQPELEDPEQNKNWSRHSNNKKKT